jgi:membrane protease YdiL (CAAX protease family)
MTDSTIKNYPTIAQSFGITGIVILGILFLSPVYSLFNNLIGKEASMLLYYILAIGIPFSIVFTIRKKKTYNTRFNLIIENKKIIPFIILGTIALLFGLIEPIDSLIPMPESIKKSLIDFGGQTGICSFILMVIAAPILEELIFRGIILDGLLKLYSPIKSILVSSFLFGFVHLNPWQFITGFIIGIFSGWIYYKTRSLSPSIIIHLTANLCGFSYRYLMGIDSRINDALLKMYSGLTDLILVIAGSLIIISFCYLHLTKEFRNSDNLNGST